MEKNNLSAKDSLKIIQTVIDQRKQRYEANGGWFVFWGVLIAIAGISQFYLLQQELFDRSSIPWAILMPLGFVITFAYKFWKGYNKKQTNPGAASRFGYVWALAGTMAMLTGFVFKEKFGTGFTAMMYAPFCIAALTAGIEIKSKTLIAMSVAATAISYASLLVEWKYHPLIAAMIGVVLLLIPGLKLYSDFKKRNRV